MKEHNLEAFYKYYSNATKEQAIEDMFLDNCNLQQEIERLNNIINELEKWLIKQEDYNEKVNSIIFNARGFEDKQVLNKLQELKGSDKE